MADTVVNHTGLSLGKKRRNKVIAYSLAGLLICGAGVYAYPKFFTTQTVAPTMQWATVKSGDVTETVSASGTVQASKQVNLNFIGTGDNKVSSLNVKVGDHVKAGQVVATLDDSTVQTQIANAQANLSAAQAKLAEAQQGATAEEIAVQEANVEKAKLSVDEATNTYNRQKQLFDAGALAKSDLDQAKSSLDQAQVSYKSSLAQLNQVKAPPQSATILTAEASVKQAEAQLQQQQIALDKLKMIAPIDGIIDQVNGNIGEVPSSGNNSTSAFIVMDNSDSGNIQVTAQISQTDIGKVKEGLNATFTTSAYENKTFNGKVSTVYPEATTEQGVTTYKVILDVDNKEGLLKPGMTMNVTVDVGTHKNVLYVPAAALKDQNGKDGVYLRTTSTTDAQATNNNSNNNNNSNSDNSTRSNKKAQSQGQGQRQQGNTGFHFQPVTIGYYSADKVEITSGLNEGDQVAIEMARPSTSSSSGNNRSSNGFGGIPGMGGAGGMGGMRGGSRN
ncbi:MAG TPA: efflux RND transporter periplasmic adaptor subunit [Bacillota bacterium]|nr:efflux RND transporter periplasmic adaptor subunit [Bacillota bacterium]